MSRTRLAVAVTVLAAAAVIAVVAWPRGRSAGTLLRTVETAEARAADFYVTLRVEGVLEAARSAPIVNSARETQIVSALPDGTWVEEGDLVVELNAADLQQEVDDLAPQVAEGEERVRSVQADAEKRLQNARSALAKAEEAQQLARTQNQAAVERAQAEIAFLERELAVAEGQRDKRERLLEERLVSVTEVEAAQDEVRSKQFSLDAARRGLARAESDAGVVASLREMDIENAKIELQQAEANLTQSVASAKRSLAAKQRQLDDAQEQLDGTVLHAPVAGMLLLEQTWDETMRSLRVGDQVREGQRVASVIDPSDMRARCDISEADIERVKMDQPARVAVAAIGGEVFPGVVMAIDNLARQRLPWEGGVMGKKVFGALIAVTAEDPRLRPDMGAAIEIVLDQVSEGIAVPIEAVFPDGEGHAVYRSQGDGYEVVPVEPGKRSDRLVAVEGELRAGESVACEVPPEELVRSTARGDAK
jgi:multidrug efflux pump subunit AcrA (membrane-fusion protein)